MNDVLETLKQFKGRGLVRDVFYALSGILLLFVLDFLLKPTTEIYPHWNKFTDLERGIIVLVLGYFFARLCLEIALFIEEVLAFVFFKRQRWNNLKQYIEKVDGFYNRRPIDLINSLTVNDMELDEFIYKNDGLAFLYERKIQTLILERVFLGFSIFLAYLITPWVLVLSVFLLVKITSENLELSDLRVESAKFFVEHKNKK